MNVCLWLLTAFDKHPNESAPDWTWTFCSESREKWAENSGFLNADALPTKLVLLVDGSIVQCLVRDDPAMAHAAKEAAKCCCGMSA